MSKFRLILNDQTGKSFWKEKKRVTREPRMASLTIKDVLGQRQYYPDAIRETTAKYYVELYRKKEYPHHPHHQQA